jgi:uncharacterized protein
VAVSLRKSGASIGGALAFWLGNPTLNPAVLVFLLFTLSWKWAFLRLVMGVILVFGVSWIVARLTADQALPKHAMTELYSLASEPAVHWRMRWLKSLGRLTIGLIPEYVGIVFVLGAARAWLFPAVDPMLGNSLLLIIGLAIAGTLFAIPTAGEIPIIMTMMNFGMSSGPASALLITLAPVSLPSLVMVRKVFPFRVLLAVTASVAGLGILSGLVAIALAF